MSLSPRAWQDSALTLVSSALCLSSLASLYLLARRSTSLEAISGLTTSLLAYLPTDLQKALNL